MTVTVEALKWSDIQRYLETDDRVLLPIGAVEQHGPHLALGTDTLTAAAVARDAGETARVLVYPPIWYGWSDGHLAFPGTVSLRPETLTAIVEDFVESLSLHGFRRFVLVNGHRRSNLPPLQIAASRLMLPGGRIVAVTDVGYLALEKSLQLRESSLGGLGHADELETSHMLHLHPEWVDMSRADVRIREHGGLLRQFMPSDPGQEGRSRYHLPSHPASFRAATGGTGLGGDARPSSAEKGRALHDALVDGLVTVLGELKSLPLPPSGPTLPRTFAGSAKPPA